jgi:hypothetical protein
MQIQSVPFSVDPLQTFDHLKKKVGRHVRLGDAKVDMARDVKEIMVSLITLLPVYVRLKLKHRCSRGSTVRCLSHLLPTLRIRMVVQADGRPQAEANLDRDERARCRCE